MEQSVLPAIDGNSDISSAAAQKLDSPAYYRSRLFTAQAGVNPLVTAAQPLLCLSERLRSSDTELSDINSHIEHELKAFESRATQFNYPRETIVLARHIVSVVLNEFLEHYQSENHFFEILEKAKTDPANHIDLLELMYICIRLGYQGQYQYLENGRVTLEDVCDELYHLIRKQRGDDKIELFIKPPPAKTVAKKSIQPLSFWLFVAFALTLVMTFNIGFSYFLNSSANLLLQDTQLINQQINFTSTLPK